MTIQVDEIAPAVPAVPFDVLLWYLAVEVPPAETKTRGGILLPAEVTSAQQTLTNVCRVAKIGSMAFTARTKAGMNYADEPCKPAIGDYVIVGRFVGQDINLKDGRRFKLIQDYEVLARTTTPEEFVAYV